MGAVTTRNCVSRMENKTRRMRNFSQQQNSPQNVCKYLTYTWKAEDIRQKAYAIRHVNNIAKC